MQPEKLATKIRTALQLRVTIPADDSSLVTTLRTLDASGGAVRAHLAYRFQDSVIALILCEQPEEGTIAVRSRGIEVENETAVIVESPARPGMLRHVLRTLEAEEIEVGYSYSASSDGRLLLVLRTSDNPKAEDVLSNLLLLHDPSGGPAPEEEAPTSRNAPPSRST